MRLLTHQFAHSETLDRARRWLIHSGVSADRIHAHRHGIPSLAVAAEPAEVQTIEMIIRIAEMNDPEGMPGFWDLSRVKPVAADDEPAAPAPAARRPTFPLAWKDLDATDDATLKAEIERQREFRELWP